MPSVTDRSKLVTETLVVVATTCYYRCMDTRVAKLVSLTDKTLARREADCRARKAEALEREIAATSFVFQAAWNQKYHEARVELECITAARRIKEWAR